MVLMSRYDLRLLEKFLSCNVSEKNIFFIVGGVVFLEVTNYFTIYYFPCHPHVFCD